MNRDTVWKEFLAKFVGIRWLMQLPNDCGESSGLTEKEASIMDAG